MALLGVALQRWKGIHTLCVDVEKHGRDLGDEDLSASVGWFTSKYPFVCPIEADFYSMLQSVKQASLNVPGNGIGYGLLKYYGGCENLGDASSPICFNYLGDTNLPSGNKPFFQYTPYSVGKMSADENELFNPLSCDTIKTEGETICTLSYLKRYYRSDEVEQLAEHIQQAFELALSSMDSKDEVKITFAKEVVDADLLEKIDMQDLSILDDLF
jgi:non-ribosomal peptide synthase protein (TIGR01720 family)